MLLVDFIVCADRKKDKMLGEGGEEGEERRREERERELMHLLITNTSLRVVAVSKHRLKVKRSQPT